MKTLKKTLCLVLAVVLALGVMVLPAYADKETYDEFEDKTDVSLKHKEAVGALTGVGAINGKRDNKGVKTLDPKDPITRAEAVTMLVRAILGKAETGLPAKNTKFTDVPASHYASKYIAYAVEQGIIAGKSSTTFAPDDLVTGYELARMALVAADIRTKYTPSEWQVQTGPTAVSAGLLVALEGIKDLNTPLTREQSAQLLWNMLLYKPESATLEVVEVGNSGKKYEVTYPEESIAGKVYNLKAIYNYSDGQGDYEDPYGTPSVKYYNGKTGESYYEGTVSGIASFFAGEKLTVGDIQNALGSSASFTANVYTNGYSDTPKATVATTNKAADTLPGITSANNRGAHVSIYRAPYGGVTYFIYVNYTYASFNATKTAAGEIAYATKADSGNFLNPGGAHTLPLAAMGDRSVATFGVTQYKGWDTVDVKVDDPAAASVQIVRRSNSNSNPYFYITGNKEPLYISSKAIYVNVKNEVKALEFSDISVDKDKYYNVWYDYDGNVLALVELPEPAVDPEVVKYENFGYVIEFSSLAAAEHYDDMTYGEDTPAAAKVLMVNVKTGNVSIYTVAVEKDKTDGKWYALGVNGKNNFEIKDSVAGVITGEKDQTTILHGFVAFKQLTGGKYGITAVEDLDKIGSTAQKFVVGTAFTTSETYPGRVNVTTSEGADLNYANGKTEIKLLYKHSVLASDKSRVDGYEVMSLTGYAGLKTIQVATDEECKDSAHNGEHVGISALFRVDKDTNMIETAYVFGAQSSTPAAKVNDYYVFVARSDTVMGKGTSFTFLHEGKPVTIPATKELLKDMELNKDNDIDVGTVCEVTIDEKGNLTKITSVVKTDKFTVDGFTLDDDGEYFGYIDDGSSNRYYLTEGCWIVDTTVEKVKAPEDLLATTVKVGATVTVYFADESGKKVVSLIVITTAD